MAYIVISNLNDKVIASPSINYLVGDTVELSDVDGSSYVFKVIERKWLDGEKLFFYFDFSLRLRDFDEIESYLFNYTSGDILGMYSELVAEKLYTGEIASLNATITEEQKSIFDLLDDEEKRTGEVSVASISKLLDTIE